MEYFRLVAVTILVFYGVFFTAFELLPRALSSTCQWEQIVIKEGGNFFTVSTIDMAFHFSFFLFFNLFSPASDTMEAEEHQV